MIAFLMIAFDLIVKGFESSPSKAKCINGKETLLVTPVPKTILLLMAVMIIILSRVDFN